MADNALVQFIESLNAKAKEAFNESFKVISDKIKQNEAAGLIPPAKVDERLDKARDELTSKLKWFNKYAIATRIEKESPIALRDGFGKPLINAHTGTDLTGLELVETVLENPSKMTERLAEFLSEDFGITIEQLYALTAPAKEAIPEPVVVAEPEPESDPDEITLVIRNESYTGLVIHAHRGIGNKVYVVIKPDKRPQSPKEHVHIRGISVRYAASADPNEREVVSEEVKVIV